MNSTLNPPTLNLAAIYRRVSTDHQDDSLELQERRVIDYAKFKQLPTGEGLTFSDPDTSGRLPIMQRTGGRALMNRLKLGDVKHLIIAKIDRLGRNARDGLGVLEFLKENNITLHITDLGGETISTQGHIGRLLLTMLLAVAEWEVEEIRDRTLKTARSKYDRNELTGNIPYGFDCVYTFADGPEEIHGKALSAADLSHRKVLSKLLVPNDAEQAIIRQMHAHRYHTPPGARVPLKRMSLKQVADHLNTLGYRTKQGSAWSAGSVDSVLTSRYTQKVLSPASLQTSALTE